MTSLNIIFAGTPAFGLPCLEALKKAGHTIKAIYTQPDRPAGRGRKLQASPIKEWALAEKVPVYQPLNFKEPQTLEELKALNADVMVVIAYGLILPKAVLEAPKLGCINVHASLLPRWRGASPIQHALLHGDEKTGVTIMQMDVGMDTGDMLKKAHCVIDKEDTAESLHDKLAALSAKPLLETLAELANANAIPQVQNQEQATYAGKISKEEAQINWQDSARLIDQKIRAFHPWPVAFTHLNEELVRIHKAIVLDTLSSALPGKIINLDKKGMDVATGNGVLRVEKIQFPGAKVISIADWLNAFKNPDRQSLHLK